MKECKYFLIEQAPGQHQPRFDMPPEETADLEELEEFSKMFKQKRIKLGNNFLLDPSLD